LRFGYLIHTALCRGTEMSEPFRNRFLIPAETAGGDLWTLRGEPLVRVIGCGDEGDVLPVVLAIEFTEHLPDPLRAALALGNPLILLGDGKRAFLVRFPG